MAGSVLGGYGAGPPIPGSACGAHPATVCAVPRLVTLAPSSHIGAGRCVAVDAADWDWGGG
ncbi:hypothetical protein, partial [Escherichia coli]|uniref:hypothetical protein n=1 Tax=Escherichia coli TaxID=562 RepID=UPI001BB0BC39